MAFVLFSHHSYIQSHKTQLLNANNYFDLETSALYADGVCTEWLDEGEIEIDGIYFDVLKVVSLGSGKSRVYVYADDFETGMTKELKDHQKHEGKKHQHLNLTDLFKVKSETKRPSIKTTLTVQEIAFADLNLNTEEGYMTPPFQPPSI